jgi:zinc transport system substrate-binding protein
VRRRRGGRLVVTGLVVATLAGCQQSPAPSPDPPKPLVLATFHPLSEFARQVGGDAVEVAVLVPPGVEPHHWEPAPADIVRLQRARVFVYHGAGLEPWVDRLLGDVLPAETLAVSATEGLPLATADLPPLHRGLAPDPHVWLDPRLATAQVERIAAALARADPSRAADYAENTRRYAADLDTLHRAFEAGLASCARRDVVVAHAAFGYLARRYGLTQVPVMGLAPGAEPTPAEMARVVRFMRARNVTHVFFEPLGRRKLAEALAREAGVATLALNPLEGRTPEEAAAGQSYVTLMQANLANLRVGLGCR